jgi:hypothetical protein
VKQSAVIIYFEGYSPMSLVSKTSVRQSGRGRGTSEELEGRKAKGEENQLLISNSAEIILISGI